ncbi:MAG: class A beta-lactamase, subclass A2 [Flavobacteriaceae bacterium]|nr:class A beta-lactamase, subclass A2 [Flavobacteriaceae bacterium]
MVAQKEELRNEILKIIQSKKADVGISIAGIESHDTLSVNGRNHYPMQSVYKFHLALVVLHEVDQGRLSLDQKIKIDKSELVPNTWSPIREEFPEGTTLTIAELLKYSVSQSDNIACDILFSLVGGAKSVNDYFSKNHFKDISILATEAEMHKNWDVLFTNWTSPEETSNLLNAFYNRKLLSVKSNDFLWKIMADTTTGKKRIKGQLPEGTIVAHKTGTSGANEKGISSATNDIGIVTLPNGNHFSISVFVSNSSENMETNEKIIADLSETGLGLFYK